jgi:hypothetical protein
LAEIEADRFESELSRISAFSRAVPTSLFCGTLRLFFLSVEAMERLFRFAATAILAVSLVPLVSHSSASSSERRMAAVPRLMLWAWERPEDLRFLDPERAGVAFLAGTVRLTRGGIDFRPRLQPLRVSSRTKLVAVIRIETTPDALLDASQVAKTAAETVRAGGLPQVVAVQIDFDATQSERPFYRNLLDELRKQLPASTPISITALASWCMGDDWMAGLPIDEAVPMLFRLGAGQSEVSSWIGSGRDFRQAECRDSLGISTDEPWKVLPSGRRVYAFSPSPWTERLLAALHWEMHSWH